MSIDIFVFSFVMEENKERKNDLYEMNKVKASVNALDKTTERKKNTTRKVVELIMT